MIDPSFHLIVIPLGFGLDSSCALEVAGTLASVGHLGVQLVTMSSPGWREAPDRREVESCAHEHRYLRWERVALVGSEPSRALAKHLWAVDAPLLVVARLSPRPFDNVPNDVGWSLADVPCPVLVVGPSVQPDWHPIHSRLVACPDSDLYQGRVRAIDQWLSTFGRRAPYASPVTDAPGGRDIAGRCGAPVLMEMRAASLTT